MTNDRRTCRTCCHDLFSRTLVALCSFLFCLQVSGSTSAVVITYIISARVSSYPMKSVTDGLDYTAARATFKRRFGSESSCCAASQSQSLSHGIVCGMCFVRYRHVGGALADCLSMTLDVVGLIAAYGQSALLSVARSLIRCNIFSSRTTIFVRVRQWAS